MKLTEIAQRKGKERKRAAKAAVKRKDEERGTVVIGRDRESGTETGTEIERGNVNDGRREKGGNKRRGRENETD